MVSSLVISPIKLKNGYFSSNVALKETDAGSINNMEIIVNMGASVAKAVSSSSAISQSKTSPSSSGFLDETVTRRNRAGGEPGSPTA